MRGIDSWFESNLFRILTGPGVSLYRVRPTTMPTTWALRPHTVHTDLYYLHYRTECGGRPLRGVAATSVQPRACRSARAHQEPTAAMAAMPGWCDMLA